MRMPPALRQNDIIRVIAPSGPFEPALAWRGLAWLSTRYRVRFDRRMFRADGYLAGTDARRRDELAGAMDDDDCAAILAVRGGYGLNRIAHEVDWQRFEKRPKWIIGFSDVTALHVECAASGLMSIHATMAAHLGRGDDRTRAGWIAAVEDPARERAWARLQGWFPGRANGTLCGGNLTILHACAAAGRLRLPEDAVLFLEDVGERPYRVDRMLTTLRIGGHLRNVRAIVLGQFTDCPPGVDRITVEDALRSALEPLQVPVVAGLAAGHAEPNEPLVLGSRATVEAREADSLLELSASCPEPEQARP